MTFLHISSIHSVNRLAEMTDRQTISGHLNVSDPVSDLTVKVGPDEVTLRIRWPRRKDIHHS